MRATVRPEKLREAFGAKLSTAVFALHKLREADQQRLKQYPEPHSIVVEFLHASRGVFPIAETFDPPGFLAWVAQWKRKRLPKSEQLALWDEMHTARRFQEHGEGAGLIPFQIEVTQGDQIQRFHNATLLGTRLSENRSWKGGVRFEAYEDRPVSEVCAEYFGMCQQFVDDFLHDHAHLLP